MNNLKKLAALSVVSVVMLSACKPAEKAEPHSAYLFAYFTGNSKADESIHFAVSDDGFNYSALNSNQPVILSEDISRTGGVRDPHICADTMENRIIWWLQIWFATMAGIQTVEWYC